MASRMDRYYKNELETSGRSSKNESLYKQIENLNEYTNIEAVSTIEKTNEIDISKVKEMLKNRENYKKQKRFKNLLEEEKEELKPIVEEKEEDKNYDIKDVLSKVKVSQPKEETKYRSLNESQYNLLKNLSLKDKEYDIDKEEAELKELINTIASNTSLNELAHPDDVGLLDELKSNTMVGDAASIKKIINEEKHHKQEDTMEMDKSFYTSSLGFTSKDFEELKTMNHKIKKSNKLIIILLVVLILLIALGSIYFIIK